MDNLRYMELVASEAEFRLKSLEMDKERILKMVRATYEKKGISISGRYTLQHLIECIDECIDDHTHTECQQLEKSVSEYASASNRRHQSQERMAFV